ncbi:MAG: alpha/beta hydrolase [Bacteroidaceae bacterium]|nr:alpha/beta hydrolase [Bacteroidaceae bacterium]
MKQNFLSRAMLAREYDTEEIDELYAISHDQERIMNPENNLLVELIVGNDKTPWDGKLEIPGWEQGLTIDLYVYRPATQADSPLPLIYFTHGGGYIMGDAHMQGAVLKDLAERNQAVVVSVEYRIATIAPFPADVKDAYCGLEYVSDHAQELGIDRSRIVVMGESAGGGLAARLALYNRDRGRVSISGQVLVYPMLDCRTGGPESVSNNPFAGEMVWTRELNQLGWTTLKGQQDIAPEDLPYYSPALASDLSRLPHAFVIVGNMDLFVDEDIAYAERLMNSGIPTELYVVPGVYHAFDMAKPASPQTGMYRTLRTAAIRQMLS